MSPHPDLHYYTLFPVILSCFTQMICISKANILQWEFLTVSKRAPLLSWLHTLLLYFTLTSQIAANGSILLLICRLASLGCDWQLNIYLGAKKCGKSGKQKLEVRCLWLLLCSQMLTLIWSRVFQTAQMPSVILGLSCSFEKCGPQPYGFGSPPLFL